VLDVAGVDRVEALAAALAGVVDDRLDSLQRHVVETADVLAK
jgi:hypothetical protein